MTESLNSMIKTLEGMAVKSFENISPEMAINYAKAFKDGDLDGKIKQAKEEFEKLNNNLKNI